MPVGHFSLSVKRVFFPVSRVFHASGLSLKEVLCPGLRVFHANML